MSTIAALDFKDSLSQLSNYASLNALGVLNSSPESTTVVDSTDKITLTVCQAGFKACIDGECGQGLGVVADAQYSAGAVF